MSGACEFKPNQQNEKVEEPENKKLEIIRLAAMATIIVAVAWMHLIQPTWLGNIGVVIVVLAGGYPIFKESLVALSKGRVNMELSMVIAILASFALFQFLPAIVITFFALLSEFVEGFIVRKGRICSSRSIPNMPGLSLFFYFLPIVLFISGDVIFFF
jgi:cation transport ATPase